MPVEIKNKIQALREKILDHDYKYYVLSQPVISDKEYDILLNELKTLEDNYPQYKSEDSPTVRVAGGIQAGFKTVKHRQKMLSLDNTYSFEELRDWEKRVHKGLRGVDEVRYVVEHKIDGVSANITYIKGRFALAATRGDGETGEDVTENIKTIRAIPLVLRGTALPDLIEVRGEVYMESSDFTALNKEREEEGEILFANPRNAASGSLKLLDSALVAKRRLNFFAHSLGDYKGPEIATQEDLLKKLRSWGMRVNMNFKVCSKLEEIIDYCNKWQEAREKIGYEIDGIVVKVNSFRQEKILGFTLKSPRWAVAYKFPARQATTEVLGIAINVGRTGVITPIAQLKPVECSGVIISHATLHNFDEIKRLNIKAGDRVLIERAGDVIPKVVKVVEHHKGGSFHIPKICPVCKGKVIKEKEEDVAFRCINPSCPAQLERGLLHFSSRQAMDIEGMGESVVSQLVRLKLARDFADIYKLKEEDLARLELFKEKKISNLLTAIEQSKTKPLSRLVFALGIRHVGEKAAFVLAKRFKNLDNLSKAKLEDLDSIYEVGHIMAKSIRDYFSLPQTKRLIDELRISGLNFKEPESELKPNAFSEKTVVFTGELKGYSRSQAESLVRASGGNTSSSVSKSTDFVVCGENPGSKYKKAKEFKLRIINEKQFSRLLTQE